MLSASAGQGWPPSWSLATSPRLCTADPEGSRVPGRAPCSPSYVPADVCRPIQGEAAKRRFRILRPRGSHSALLTTPCSVVNCLRRVLGHGRAEATIFPGSLLPPVQHSGVIWVMRRAAPLLRVHTDRKWRLVKLTWQPTASKAHKNSFHEP